MEKRMHYQTILTERRGDVLVITLNRPERLNAAPPLMFDEIGQALDNLDGARAVLVTGAGRAFCSGADLAALGAGMPGDNAYAALTGSYNPGMLKLAELGVPLVSAVNGAAAGIGCSLALIADFCVIGEGAYLLQAFVNIGLVPDGGVTWLLPRLVGKARAAEMLMLGERIHGPKADDWGLAHKCVPDAEVFESALALATRLAAGPTLSLGLMRNAMRDAMAGDFAAALQREAEDQRQAGNSADGMEGGMAFLQKRKAEFKGR